jgi:hypothetical protein
MFPKPNDRPISGTQTPEVPLVSFSVCLQLGFPKVGKLVLPRWQSPSVPKIAVNENRDPLLSENDIGRAGHVLTVSLEA